MKLAAQVTCRDCFGFGHTMKKCPTGRKFDEYRNANQLLRVTISRMRSKLANKLREPTGGDTWFFRESVAEDVGNLPDSNDKQYVL